MTALLLAAVLLQVPTGEPAAMVLTRKGTITLERGNEKPRPLGVMTLLWPGDRIEIADGGEATLMFLGDGNRERVKAQATVEAKGCGPAAAVERIEGPKLPPANFESLRKHATSSRGAVGVLRGDNPPVPQIVTPLYGAAIQTDRPSLTWPDAGADAYLVQLFSGGEGKDKRLLWKTTVKEATLAFPEKEKSLQLGANYRWSVNPVRGKEVGAVPIADSEFLVLPQNLIKLGANLKPLRESKSPADLLLAAVSYEAIGVYDEALRLYERLAKMSPGEANYQVALAGYYERAGRMDLAREARERAKQLGAK